MSIPNIPGYLRPEHQHTLAQLWQRPPGPLPDDLWPLEVLGRVDPEPAGWVCVAASYFADTAHGGTGCVLIEPGDTQAALADTTWAGRDLGAVSCDDDGIVVAGLRDGWRGMGVEFFAQGRRPSGASVPVFDVHLPFLWYWDAFPTGTGWKYLNRAGREQDLINTSNVDSDWKIEVRALEFRQYLAAARRGALLQIDHVPKIDCEHFERVDDTFRNDWAHLDFHALVDDSLTANAFSRLLGQYVVTGLDNHRKPRWQERRQPRDYPSFIYGIDPTTGAQLEHTCDPDTLGTYFDTDNSRLHYLTPAYFKPEVLHPYVAEPHRYRISATRLECLDLWGLEISFNTAGLVEVYLGDIGRDLPDDEWGHWRSYNVLPDGTMAEERFRRDFLNQPTEPVDPVGVLRRLRTRAAAASAQITGRPIWRDLTYEVQKQFDSLVGPLTDDPVALNAPLLLLTKVMIDAIDPAPLKDFLGDAEKDEKSISLLTRFAHALGATDDPVGPLRDLQTYRSQGGVAHLPGSRRTKAARSLGITGLPSTTAFRAVVARLTGALQEIVAAMEQSGERNPHP